jgi:exonuclease SbcD
LMRAFTAKLHQLRDSEHFNSDFPAILSAHIAVRGSELPTLFRLSDQEDVVFSDADLPTGFAYVALGHIHKPQCLGGQSHVRYSGSIERLDLGERYDEKSVVVFDVGPEGLQGEPRTLPLEATPVYEIDIRSPGEEIPQLKAKLTDGRRHLVKINCSWTAGVDNREEMLRELDQLFPRWYDRQVSESSALGPTLTIGEPTRGKSFEDTVRDYLNQELAHHEDDVREAVLAKAEALLREVHE